MACDVIQNIVRYGLRKGKKSLARLTTIFFLIALASCKMSSFYDSLGDKIKPPPPLAIAPSSATLALGNSVTFSAAGGTQPYAYSIASGTGVVNS